MSYCPITEDSFKAKEIRSLATFTENRFIYARLKGSFICSTFDLRSDYYHILSEDTRTESAFVDTTS